MPIYNVLSGELELDPAAAIPDPLRVTYYGSQTHTAGVRPPSPQWSTAPSGSWFLPSVDGFLDRDKLIPGSLNQPWGVIRLFPAGQPSAAFFTYSINYATLPSVVVPNVNQDWKGYLTVENLPTSEPVTSITVTKL